MATTKFAKLEGSVKQIKYADDIRRKRAKEIQDYIKRTQREYGHIPFAQKRISSEQKKLEKLMKETSAPKIINDTVGFF